MSTDRNHLDAETVAAWIDGGLDSTALAAAEAHASNCERCQALLATVMKTMPVGDVAPGFSRGIANSWWRWWMAPIAATAAAVTLWMVVPQEQLQQVATAPTAEVAAPAEPAAGARARDEAAPPVAQPTQPARRSPGEGGAARADEQKFSEVKRKAEGQRAALQKPQAAQEKLGDNKAEDRLARVEAASAKASAPKAEPARAPAAPPAAAAPAEAAANRDAGFAQLRKQAAPLVFVSPDPRFRWRATIEGIEFSVDGGRSWLPVRLPQGEVVTGGASPAPLACWLVGRRGLVLLATDGTNFTRIPFPETVDLASVSSPELRIAVVTTADGRTFRTENAGRSWIRQ